ALLGQLFLADRVELVGGEDRRRGGPEPAAAARDQEQACEEHPRVPGGGVQHGKPATTYSILRRQKLFDFPGAARYYEGTQEASYGVAPNAQNPPDLPALPGGRHPATRSQVARRTRAP